MIEWKAYVNARCACFNDREWLISRCKEENTTGFVIPSVRRLSYCLNTPLNSDMRANSEQESLDTSLDVVLWPTSTCQNIFELCNLT